MKHLLIISGLLVCSGALISQVSMRMNLPERIVAGTEQEFQVIIQKGSVTNFSKFQMQVPEGITISEVESSGGSFSNADQQLKVIWAITPSEPEISLKMMLKAEAEGTYTISQKYYYLENEGKREIEVDPFEFMVVPSSESVGTQTAFVALKPHVPEAFPSSSSKTVDPGNHGELQMHALQLKKDSREAHKVGENELRKAQDNLEDANTVIRQAEYLDDTGLKRKVLKQANAAKDRAELDIQIANKILTLARSLEDDASDIQKQNLATTATATAAETPVTPEVKPQKQVAAANKPDDSIVYKLQLGAFSKHPSKSEFRSLGSVVISNENGLYKVLLGHYTTKEAAIKKREQVTGLGFDAFIVGYRNGIRIQ